MNRIVHDLERVYLDNVRTNQIGGVTDGISAEVASDLSYSTPEQTQRIIEETQRQAAIEASRNRHPSVTGRQTGFARPVPHVLRGESEGDFGSPEYHKPRVRLVGDEQTTALRGITRAKESFGRPRAN